MLPGIWSYTASSAASVLVAALTIICFIRCGYHREASGALARRRLGSLVVLSASTYTFLVIVISQLVVHGPDVSMLVKYGFGDARVAWLLLGVTLDGIFRIWDEFR